MDPATVCLVTDIEAYTRRGDRAQIRLQDRLLAAMDRAAAWAGLELAACRRQDRGDGLLILLPPGADLGRVVPSLLRSIADALARTNARESGAADGGRMRLRTSLAAGPVSVAATGYVGEAVVTSCRLLDSGPVREALTSAPDKDLAVIADDDLYARTLRSTGTYHPVSVALPDKGFSAGAWVGVPPAGDPLRPDPPPRHAAPKWRIPRAWTQGPHLLALGSGAIGLVAAAGFLDGPGTELPGHPGGAGHHHSLSAHDPGQGWDDGTYYPAPDFPGEAHPGGLFDGEAFPGDIHLDPGHHDM